MRQEINLHSDNHYMIDIETLDTRPSAHILAIACVRFTPATGKVHESREWLVDMEGQGRRTTNSATVEWWHDQCEQYGNIAKRIFYGNKEEKIHLSHALNELQDFIKGNAYVWGKGIDFDLPILENAIEEMANKLYHIPWQYWAKCDVRTLYHVIGKPPEHVRKAEKAHDPISDCLAQIRGVHWCLSQIEA